MDGRLQDVRGEVRTGHTPTHQQPVSGDRWDAYVGALFLFLFVSVRDLAGKTLDIHNRS